jgi:hypothetical protein
MGHSDDQIRALGEIGQMLPKIVSTQMSQNVHSYVQMRAKSELGGNDLLQCSQVGLSSSMISLHYDS